MIPLRLPSLDILIHADRRLAFQVLTAFDASAQGSEASSRVLSRSGDRLLVEFRTPGPGLFRGRKVYRTVEWVLTHEPDWVEFEGVAGPLPMLRDRLVLDEEGGCTRLRYESEFALRGGVLGWLLGRLAVRPKMMRLARDHLEELKETIEARASKSSVFPQLPCLSEVVPGPIAGRDAT